MDYNKHLTEEILNKFHTNSLNDNESVKLLEHISHCDFCAEKFSNSFNSINTLKMPPDFKQSIIKKSKFIKRANASSPKLFLLKYSLRVCASMAGALIIIYSSTLAPKLDFSEAKYNNYKAFELSQRRIDTYITENNQKNSNTKVLDTVNKTLTNISNIIKSEVQNYD